MSRNQITIHTLAAWFSGANAGMVLSQWLRGEPIQALPAVMALIGLVLVTASLLALLGRD